MQLRTIDLGRTASASDVIYDALRDGIVSGVLKEGESIRQDRIAQMFNVSRIPVREALKRLEAQGLVTTQRYKGAVVSTLSAQELEEIFELRADLEAKLIRGAVANMTKDGLALARHNCDAFDGEADSARWGELNRAFHVALYEGAGRPYHLKLIGELNDRVDAYVRAQLVLTDGAARARREHRASLEACARGDAEQAAELTRAHIMGAYDSLRAFLRDGVDSQQQAI